MRTNRKIVENDVVKRIISTMDVRGIRQRDLMRNLGIAEQAFVKWKYDNGKSYMNHLDQIARYLNVTQDYLLYGIGSIDSPDYSIDELELINLYQQMPNDDKIFIRRIANTLVNNL